MPNWPNIEAFVDGVISQTFGEPVVYQPVQAGVAQGIAFTVTAVRHLRVERMRFAAVIGQTGRVFLGVSGMNKANGTGVIKEFWPTGSGGGVADSFDIWAEDSRHLLLPSDYYVDANNAGDGLIVAYWT